MIGYFISEILSKKDYLKYDLKKIDGNIRIGYF